MPDTTTNSTNNILNGITRGVIAAGGGATMAASHDELLQLVGALATVLSLVWSIWEKLSAGKPVASAPVVGAPVAGGQTDAPTDRRTGLPLPLLLAGISLAMVVIGCVATAPGSSPFIVAVERVQTIAPGAFDTVTAIDHSNRPYWQTNAPRFHAFVENLRRPVPVSGTNYPACLAALLQLQEAKVAYKNGRGTSNTLYTALTEVQLLLNDASAWAAVVTKPQ